MGTVDGSNFFDFLRGKLIPEMQPFDGESKHSILIVDNCSIHHVQEVKDLLRDAGILYFFLLPYSPDLNPVEELFSYIKYYLKEHDLVLQSMTSMVPVLNAAFNSVTAQQCNGWIEHASLLYIYFTFEYIITHVHIYVVNYMGIQLQSSRRSGNDLNCYTCIAFSNLKVLYV